MSALGRRVGSVVVIAILAAASVAPAAAHDPSPIFEGDGLWPQDADLTFDWSADSLPPADMRTAIKAGAADASASRGSRAATFRPAVGAGNLVLYGTDVVCGSGGLACMRRNPPTWFGLWFRENGHVFDWGALRWCQLYASPPAGCYDVENITLDELGHVEVLDHHVNYSDLRDYTDSVVQAISHAKAAVGWNAHAFGRCDVAQLQRQYDVQPTTKISTCLDIPSDGTLAPSSYSVGWDGTVRFTAHLEVLDDPTVTFRLRGNALDARTVVLQRRPLGGAWADDQVLVGAGGGTYTGIQRLRSTTDWRLVFRKPSDEGLRAFTSAAIRVTVTGACSTPPCPLSIPVPAAW